MRYSRRLFEPDEREAYAVRKYQNKEQWSEGRSRGIGGSDSAAVLGRNPWKTNVDLYREKTGLKEAPDISNNAAVEFGRKAEESIRYLFKLDHPELIVNYVPESILVNKENNFLLYSPDGLVEEVKTGRKGILEIKTTTILQSMHKEKWKDTIPENYLFQCLHGLIVTGFDFVILRARLKYSDDYIVVKEYTIEREIFKEEIEEQKKRLINFWNNNVLARKEPALILPELEFEF